MNLPDLFVTLEIINGTQKKKNYSTMSFMWDTYMVHYFGPP